MNFFQLSVFLAKGNISYFDISVDKQKKIIESLKYKNSFQERSFNQYKCQIFFFPKFKIFFFHIFSFIITPIYLIICLCKNVNSKFIEKKDAIYYDNDKEFDIIPNSLKEKYTIFYHNPQRIGCLNCKDILYISKIMLHYFYVPYFVFKCIVKISLYKQVISLYKPFAIIVMNENSFTSSILTEFCHLYKIIHIDVMHGEKLYCIRDSFFKFDQCYVWDEFYKNLLIKLKADRSQFKIEIPKSLRFDYEKYQKKELYADFRYYLQINTEEEIRQIVQELQVFKDKGAVIKYRLHPRFSNYEMIKKIIPEKYIEYPQKISIIESISNSKYIISAYSTVLNQAYHSGKKIIIDDVTNSELYKKLEDRDYIFTKVEILKLSQLKNNLNI